MRRLFSPEDEPVGRIHDRLVHLGDIKQKIPDPFGFVQILSRTQISLLVESAFWASLRFSEGRTTRVCIVVADPERFLDAVGFATPVTYDESQIVKLASAVPRSGCLLVSGLNDELTIWGFGRSRSGSSWMDTVTIDLAEPGTLRVGVGPFRAFAVLNGRSNLLLEGTQIDLAAYLQRVLRKELPQDDIIETQAVWRECLAVMDLVRMIVVDGHGGMVLVVPAETGPWTNALNPFAYQFAVPDTTIRDAIRQELKDRQTQGEALQRVSTSLLPDDLKNLVVKSLLPHPADIGRAVRAIASLAAVDGAVVMTRDMKILGFGAKIATQSDTAPAVCIFGPQPGKQAVVLSPLEDLGGTRHQSAARFVAANRDAVALVISQDRHLSVMHWDKELDSVAIMRNAEWWM